ncbi:hypothetical protein ACFW93_42380 [Streptomyces canus]|uniref:hypothetical protein n=1 Tax=Streptomyces canus TaxID=58343 RepID=UPI0036B63757
MTTYEKDPDPRAHRTHLSAAGLRARGWSGGMIRRLLGEPALRRANPFSRTAPPTRLYSVERVEAAERSAEFRAVSAVAARRSAAVQEAASRRRREVLARSGERESGPENSGAVPSPAPDDRKVVRRSPQEST